MTNLDSALWKRMIQIVQIENRPFSLIDFVPKFSISGQEWSIGYGTFRNKISLLCKQGKVDVEYYSPQAFYTLSGIKFSKPLDHHTGVKDPVLTLMRQQQLEQQQQQHNIRRIINHPIYKLIQNLPFDSNALHDIRLRFRVGGIWLLFSTFSENYQRSNPVSKDILFKVFKIDQLIVRVTIHRTDTISLMIGCSSSPVAVDTDGILRLTNALRTVRESLLEVIIDSGKVLQNSKLIIPCIMSWLVTLWHFGADASVTYTGEKFFASWQVGQNALLAVYSKEWKRKGKHAERRIRIELQESPKKPLQEALEDKRNMLEKLKKGG